MKINTNFPGTISGFVSVSSLGDVESEPVPFAISVCASPLLTVKTASISNLVKATYHLGEEDGKVTIP